uniref:Protachykinin-1 n=1 Tax=Macaca mulatta TaxID=9544 RepID=A0A1D5RJ01_MACMU
KLVGYWRWGARLGKRVKVVYKTLSPFPTAAPAPDHTHLCAFRVVRSLQSRHRDKTKSGGGAADEGRSPGWEERTESARGLKTPSQLLTRPGRLAGDGTRVRRGGAQRGSASGGTPLSPSVGKAASARLGAGVQREGLGLLGASLRLPYTPFVRAFAPQEELPEPFEHLLQRIARRPKPQQFFGLMGKRDAGHGQISHKRHKTDSFVGLMGKRALNSVAYERSAMQNYERRR